MKDKITTLEAKTIASVSNVDFTIGGYGECRWLTVIWTNVDGNIERAILQNKTGNKCRDFSTIEAAYNAARIISKEAMIRVL